MATFNIKENDTSPALEATLTDEDGAAIDLSAASVQFHMSPLGESGTLTVDASAVIRDAAGGVVAYEWSTGDTSAPGEYQSEFEVTYSDGTIESFPNDGYFSVIVHPEVN